MPETSMSRSAYFVASPLAVARMVVLPGATPLISPVLEFTLATLSSLEVQMSLRSSSGASWG